MYPNSKNEQSRPGWVGLFVGEGLGNGSELGFPGLTDNFTFSELLTVHTNNSFRCIRNHQIDRNLVKNCIWILHSNPNFPT